MNTQTTQFDDLHLVALPSAVNCTDLFVRFSLSEWSLRGLTDEAATVASQLAASVVETADSQDPGLLTVRLRLSGDSLVIEIEDNQPGPSPSTAPEVAHGSAGVVDKDGPGKRIWCELPLPGGVNASEVPLPRRERKKPNASGGASDEMAEVDPEVIERLLTGLNKPMSED